MTSVSDYIAESEYKKVVSGFGRFVEIYELSTENTLNEGIPYRLINDLCRRCIHCVHEYNSVYEIKNKDRMNKKLWRRSRSIPFL